MIRFRPEGSTSPGLVALALAGLMVLAAPAGAQPRATAGSEAVAVRPSTPPPPAAGAPQQTSSAGPVTAGPATAPVADTPPPGEADTEVPGPATSQTQTPPAAPAPSGPDPLAIAGLALALVVAAAGVAAFLQLSNRLGRLQKAPAKLEAQPAAPPPTSLVFDPSSADSQTLVPRLQPARHSPDESDLAQLLGGLDASGRADVRRASVALSHAVAELIGHALDTDEKMALLGRAVERAALRQDGGRGPSPDLLARMIDERLAAARGEAPPRPSEPPVSPPPPAAPPAPPPSRYGELWPAADALFRRVGLASVTEEIFNQALASKKSEILADGSYAQRPDLLRGSDEAQNMAAVLRLASSEWANRSDDVTIPTGYRVHFEQFLQDYADPEAGFELIWAQSGESAKDSAHETSRIDGVRHEVVSGVRWPGLRGGGEVYMRAKVAIS